MNEKEVSIKTHLIVKNVYDEYDIRWCGSIVNTKPKFKNGKLVFAIVGGGYRTEINTTDMTEVERCAKRTTAPKGRGAISTDSARIFIVEEDDNEKLLGILTHNRIKEFGQMYDKVLYRD